MSLTALSQSRWSKILLLALLGGVALSACSTVVVAPNETVIRFYNPLDNLGLAPSVLRIVYIIAGILLLVAGWWVYEYIVAIAGFLVGASLGLSLVGGTHNEAIAFLALIAGGLIGALLALVLQYVAIFFIGAYIGAVVTAQLWAALSTTPVPDLAIVIGGIVGGLILLTLAYQFIVLVSAAVGAVLLGTALNLGVVWMLVFFIVGIILQYALTRITGSDAFVRRRYVRRRVVWRET